MNEQSIQNHEPDLSQKPKRSKKALIAVIIVCAVIMLLAGAAVAAYLIYFNAPANLGNAIKNTDEAFLSDYSFFENYRNLFSNLGKETEDGNKYGVLASGNITLSAEDIDRNSPVSIPFYLKCSEDALNLDISLDDKSPSKLLKAEISYQKGQFGFISSFASEFSKNSSGKIVPVSHPYDKFGLNFELSTRALEKSLLNPDNLDEPILSRENYDVLYNLVSSFENGSDENRPIIRELEDEIKSAIKDFIKSLDVTFKNARPSEEEKTGFIDGFVPNKNITITADSEKICALADNLATILKKEKYASAVKLYLGFDVTQTDYDADEILDEFQEKVKEFSPDFTLEINLRKDKITSSTLKIGFVSDGKQSEISVVSKIKYGEEAGPTVSNATLELSCVTDGEDARVLSRVEYKAEAIDGITHGNIIALFIEDETEYRIELNFGDGKYSINFFDDLSFEGQIRAGKKGDFDGCVHFTVDSVDFEYEESKFTYGGELEKSTRRFNGKNLLTLDIKEYGGSYGLSNKDIAVDFFTDNKDDFSYLASNMGRLSEAFPLIENYLSQRADGAILSADNIPILPGDKVTESINKYLGQYIELVKEYLTSYSPVDEIFVPGIFYSEESHLWYLFDYDYVNDVVRYEVYVNPGDELINSVHRIESKNGIKLVLHDFKQSKVQVDEEGRRYAEMTCKICNAKTRKGS